MIVLTCDVHHATLRTANQFHADDSEVRIAARFAAMLAAYRIKATFFVSGRAFDEEAADLRPIADSPWIELGGHTYDCFAPTWPHRVWNKVAGSYPGPQAMERRSIRRTIAAAHRATGRRLRCWRDHMYLGGPNTAALLAEAGISTLSDGVRREAGFPARDAHGVWQLPINVIPDHEHLIHAERTRSWVRQWQRRYGWRDDFGPESYDVDAWCDRVLADLDRNRARGVPSVMILHPITLELADRMRSARRILDAITGDRTMFVSELSAKEVS